MKERPILFSGEMVRALLRKNDPKTQTRRVVKVTESGRVREVGSHRNWHLDDPDAVEACPYGQPGDRLWVREAFRLRLDQDHKPPRQDWWKAGAWYGADGDEPTGCGGGPGKLRPSIHMPRWASRINLEVTGVRVERVQDISEEDAKAEGVTGWHDTFPDSRQSLPRDYRDNFEGLWDSINAKRDEGRYAWKRNPWVWVVEFKRIALATDTPATEPDG